MHIRTAAALLGVSTRTVRRLTARGELPAVEVGGRVMYSPLAVEHFVARSTRYGPGGGREPTRDMRNREGADAAEIAG